MVARFTHIYETLCFNITEIPTLPFWPETSHFRWSFPTSHFHSIFSRFCNFPLAKEDNVFPASLVFTSTILCCFFCGISRIFYHWGILAWARGFLGAVMPQNAICYYLKMQEKASYRPLYLNFFRGWGGACPWTPLDARPFAAPKTSLFFIVKGWNQ